MSERGIWVKRTILSKARDVVRGRRIELETSEPWIRDTAVNVQHIWERDDLEKYVKHLSELEEVLVGLLALADA